jgi:hypothetical protein
MTLEPTRRAILRGGGDLEDFLGETIATWRNYTAEPLIPSTPDGPGQVARQYFEDLVRRAAVELPRKGGFRLANAYWRHISKYGEFREDKIFEEQEEDFRESR